MQRVEITDKPCAQCGQALELFLHNVKIESDDPARTWKVVRTLKCPRCGFEREDDPAPPSQRQ